MKRYIIALVSLLLVAGGSARACDFCNCLSGINPYYDDSDKLLLHYLLQRSSTQNGMDATQWFNAKPTMGGLPGQTVYHMLPGMGISDGSIPSTETRSTLEFAYQHHFSEHWMATALVPLSYLDIQSGRVLTIAAFGDPSLLVHYVMRDILPVNSTLQIGAGVKLPLADHQLRDGYGTLIDPRMQPGTGSVDFDLNAVATAQFGTWTVGIDAFGRLNGANREGNRLGNALSISATVNRDIVRDNESQFAVVGIVGLRGELAAKDRIEEEIDPDSGSAATYGSLGGQLALGSVRFDLSFFVPIYQHRSDHEPERTRILSGVRYAF